MTYPTTIVWDMNDGGANTPVADSVSNNPTSNTSPGGDLFSQFMPPEPWRDGYEFGGWWCWDSLMTPVPPRFVLATDPVLGSDVAPATVTLHAMWRVPVTLDANGGAVEPVEIGYLVGAVYYGGPPVYGSSLPVPSRYGYLFSGWWTSATGGTVVVAGTEVNGSPHTLYAHWRAGAAVTVFFAPNGGSLVASPSSIVYEPPCVYGGMPNVTRPGYAFFGWWNSPTAGIRMFADSPVYGPSHTLYAHWDSEIGCTVIFIANGGVLAGEKTVPYPRGAVYGDFPAVTRAGWLFMGWWTELNGGRAVLGDHPVGTTDHYLYARWSLDTIPDEDTLFVSTDGWVPVTVPKFYASLPGPIRGFFDSWLNANIRMLRLGLVVEGVVSDFRKGTDAENNEQGKKVSDSVPVSCLRHVLCSVWYNLAVEMGMTYEAAMPYRAGWEDANVYLRVLFLEVRMGVKRFAAAGGGTPLYSGRAAKRGFSTSGGVPAPDAVGGGVTINGNPRGVPYSIG